MKKQFAYCRITYPEFSHAILCGEELRYIHSDRYGSDSSNVKNY